MNPRLNFNRSLAWPFLALVSFWCIQLPSLAYAEEKDPFLEFEKAPEDTPSPPAKAAVKPIPSPTPHLSPEQKIEHLKAEIRKSPKNVHLFTDLAEELFKIGQYDKVTALLWKHIDKINRPALLLLAQAHEKRGESADVIRAANLLISKNPKDFEAHTLIGSAHYQAKKSKEAIESFKAAIEANPKYEPAYLGLVELYDKREPPNLYELRILYQDMIENIGSRPIYFLKLCEINTLDGTFEAAVKSCSESVRKYPSKADSHVYMGLSQKGMGEDDKAKATFKKTALKFPNSEFALFQYGKSLEDEKNYLDAMKAYKKATESDGKSARSWLGLATSSFEVRKYDIAIIAYKNACRLDKKTAVSFRRATTVLRTQKNSEWTSKFEESSDNCTF